VALFVFAFGSIGARVDVSDRRGQKARAALLLAVAFRHTGRPLLVFSLRDTRSGSCGWATTITVFTPGSRPWFFDYPLGTFAAVPAESPNGILRTQLFDIDSPHPAGRLKQSTLAAAVVALVYVLSRGASPAAVERTRQRSRDCSPRPAVVFFLAPLQRIAERVATVGEAEYARHTGVHSVSQTCRLYEASCCRCAPGRRQREGTRVLLRRLRDFARHFRVPTPQRSSAIWVHGTGQGYVFGLQAIRQSDSAYSVLAHLIRKSSTRRNCARVGRSGFATEICYYSPIPGTGITILAVAFGDQTLRLSCSMSRWRPWFSLFDHELLESAAACISSACHPGPLDPPAARFLTVASRSTSLNRGYFRPSRSSSQHLRTRCLAERRPFRVEHIRTGLLVLVSIACGRRRRRLFSCAGVAQNPTTGSIASSNIQMALFTTFSVGLVARR
jgi:hypothetical protein